VSGNVATLEAFFQAVAQALFAAQPLTTVALGGVSFVEQFGRPLVKEDLIFSAVAVVPGQLWVGTLGGGLRRIDGRGATPQATQPMTHLDGLPSNLILALAVGPDGALWVATDKGVTRLREAGDAVTLTTFAALDGLALPVRDVAVDAVGTAWLATDGGLFRIVLQGGTVQGLVVDAFSHPVVGADVTLLGTPFHAVTDATGQFALANLPGGPQQLQVDGHLAVGGPFPVALRTITVPDEGTLTLEPPVELKPWVPEEPCALIVVSGNGQMGTVGTALAEPLVVAAVQAGGIPVSGCQVTFKVTAGQGTLAPGQPVLTDAQGRAAETLTLGTKAGVQQVTAATLGLTPVTFTVTGVADRDHIRLLKVRGDTNQVGKPGEILREPLVVLLEDQFHNPVGDVSVTAQVLSGGVVLVNRPASSTTLADRPSQSQTSGSTIRTEMTGNNGEASFFVQVVSTASEATVQMTALQAEPVKFLLNVTRTVVGTHPQAVAVGDVNHDGIPDLVTANAGSNDVSVLLGRGDGTFKAEQRFPVGAQPQAIAVADVNHDGRPDLVTANQGSDDVSVLLGRGDGTFKAEQRFVVGDSPVSVAVADLNGDGLSDLVTANVGFSAVTVLLGRGDGTFGKLQLSP
jgi:FG-GAP-like repeat/Carboxypeptidase regulatory-like domain/FG-GAP repeat/Two component regulator propeller